MLTLLAVIIGFLYAASIYMFLRRSIVKLVLGIIFLSHATNLLLFVTGGLRIGKPAFTDADGSVDLATVSDPLPQALILTAIVIGLGITAFSLVLVYRFYKETGTVDLDELAENDQS
jgi:multicomponent Na+:H+ antiporter subunit C